MYALRAAMVSFATFALLCTAALLWVRALWPVLRRRLKSSAKPTLATTLFTLQIVPVLLGIVAVVGFALPSFFRFEPRSAEEELGLAAVVLASAGAAFIVASASRTIVSLWRSRRAAAVWAQETGAAGTRGGIPAYCSKAAELLAVSGVAKPMLFISAGIADVLTPQELECALAHEMVHVKRRDNLAKLIVLLCRLPGLKEIERAWLEAVEMTADERAVTSKAEALALASALVKVSRLRSQPLPELALGFAAPARGPLAARVSRLLAWEMPKTPNHSLARTLAGTATFTAVAACALAYHPILVHAHAFTEWLVR